MKKGDLVNMYNSHSKDGTPDEQTFCSKGILVKPYKSKHKVWDGFESWTIDVFWDKLSNLPHRQYVWFVHPNDLEKRKIHKLEKDFIKVCLDFLHEKIGIEDLP